MKPARGDETDQGDPRHRSTFKGPLQHTVAIIHSGINLPKLSGDRVVKKRKILLDISYSYQCLGQRGKEVSCCIHMRSTLRPMAEALGFYINCIEYGEMALRIKRLAATPVDVSLVKI
ncbi:hypothetical protein Tco_0960565 [Tanacetum coccineum]